MTDPRGSPPPPWVPPPAPADPAFARWGQGWAPPRRMSNGRIAAIVVVATVVLVIVPFACAVWLGSSLGPLLGRTQLPDLTVGQCFNGGRAPIGTETQVVFGVDVVDCDEPHESELMATFDYPGSGSGLAYPVSRYAEDECIRRFADYIGISFTSSFLEMTFLQPQGPSWAFGDYSIQCVVHPPVGQESSTGSYRDSRR